MQKELKTVSGIQWPLLIVDLPEWVSVSFEEIVEVQVWWEDKKRSGKVLSAEKDKALVQMFEKPSGISVNDTKVKFLWEVSKIWLSTDMLWRIFDGSWKPLDGWEEIIPEKKTPINGEPLNPASRAFPNDFIQTWISTIDTMNTLVRWQKLPIFSWSWLPHNKVATLIWKNAKVNDWSEFVVVFWAMGVTFEESQFFQSEFEKSWALKNAVLFLNTASDPVVERIATPRLALTTAEYLAYEKDMHVLVILTDMTNYAEALREVSAARKEVPWRRWYPWYLYTDLSTIYERAWSVVWSKWSVTQIAILTMPEDDKTHPIPDLTWYITEWQIVVDRSLHSKDLFPSIDILSSLSRLWSAWVWEWKTREDHSSLKDQLFASYARWKEVRELAVVLWEAALDDADKAHLKFADDFENEFVNQWDTDRNIDESLDIWWKLLMKHIPENEMKRVKREFIDKYWKQVS